MQRTIVLAIAGSDSGGGAGIQADLKSIHAQGAHAVTVLTAITAQNTMSVQRAEALPLDLIQDQLDAVCDDFEIRAVKTGMLARSDIVELVASHLKRRQAKRIVVDPVMISKHGKPLLVDDAVDALQTRLIPLAHVVTPNLHEAQRLAGRAIGSREEMEEAARRILSLGPRAVVVKGGHLQEGAAPDLLMTTKGAVWVEGERFETPHTHGTGCTFASALAARLALGEPLETAVAETKRFITEAIRRSLHIGHGLGPVDPLYAIPGAREV
ncbi:MAG: bifunctional hydroxymethylpyrimidine kinase/phosphomethylpyrimidine kinase [Candidatus Eisenbacteria bacterium]|nr:bifunctional hydroxymethylpyrimidine kinase/phosphomethylpyrimidine kinase [Candidatus Eisenbacteria bacterium]